ncbi:MAG: HD domain-containing protein [Patescibacteria group bacterium]
MPKIRKLVEAAAKSKNNLYGYSAWTHHIVLVEKYGARLAKQLYANEEIVRLACLLHDYSCLVNKKFYRRHHQHSARLAEQILKAEKYPQEKIKLIKDCILSHRGSVKLKKKTLEAKILADADALAHFAALDDLFFLAYKILKLNTDDGRQYVLRKLDRSWQKLSPTAKEIIRERYILIKKVFPLK